MTDEIAHFTSLMRRDLHAHPEVGLQLPRTQDKVLAALDGLPLQVTTGSSCSSVAAVLRGSSPGPTFLLRADMDALPVQERTGLPFTSTNDAMHACGHDLHTAMLAGAAQLLCARRDHLVGDVVLAFQPGEEGHGGASRMLAEGLLDASGARPVAAYALHVLSFGMSSGSLTSRPGPVMSAADHLRVVVRGSGGHGSAPHRATDPVPAAAAMITALEVAVTREFDVFDSVVVTVGVVRAGEAHNVIPDTAQFEATVRSFTPQARDRLATVLPRVLQGVALAHGLDVDVDLVALFPPTVNDAAEADWAMQHARQTLGPDKVQALPNPVAASEDFSIVLQQVPEPCSCWAPHPPASTRAPRPTTTRPTPTSTRASWSPEPVSTPASRKDACTPAPDHEDQLVPSSRTNMLEPLRGAGPRHVASGTTVRPT